MTELQSCGNLQYALSCMRAGQEEAPSRNINLHGAVLHVIGDLVQSVGVAVAGALIWWKQV